MLRKVLVILGAVALALSAAAEVTSFPASFRIQDIKTTEATIHVRVGGHGPAVVLLHGFGDTGDMWAPLAADLARDHTVIVPDLRGMGLSSQPSGGYDKRTQAADVRSVLTALGIDRAAVIGHDIGTMVAYAYAARYPDKVEKLVVMDAPVPGIPPWDSIVRLPALWHFDFGGPDAERLVAGRERIYLDRFWNEFAGDPRRSTRPLVNITPGFTPGLAPCMPRSPSSTRSARMLRTTRPRWPRNSPCPCWQSAAKSRLVETRRW
jgi:pimeloyl-ACP methyl ester carboxylesterase